jgi:hypothetical protein
MKGMIDYMNIGTDYSIQDYERMTVRMGINAPINSDKVHSNLGNLRLTYYPNKGFLRITNSFHKYYNLEFDETIQAAINHNDFDLSKFYTVVDYLTEYVLQKSATDIMVSRNFEFGVNVNSNPYPGFDLISKWLSHCITHMDEFYTVPPYKGKPCMRSCYHSDIRIKGYDKSIQANVSNSNILRHEIVITEIRKLRNILSYSTISLADLATVDAWNKLYTFLIATYDQIRKIPHLPGQTLTNSEIHSIYGYCNGLMRRDLQLNNSRYFFNKINAENKRIYTCYNNSNANFFNVLRDRIVAKQDVLINPNSDKFQHL